VWLIAQEDFEAYISIAHLELDTATRADIHDKFFV
jgi:hypothetical protein